MHACTVRFIQVSWNGEVNAVIMREVALNEINMLMRFFLLDTAAWCPAAFSIIRLSSVTVCMTPHGHRL